jgi:hypothetical protein
VRLSVVRNLMMLTILGADVRQLTTWSINEGKEIDDYLYNKKHHPESPLEPPEALALLIERVQPRCTSKLPVPLH